MSVFGKLFGKETAKKAEGDMSPVAQGSGKKMAKDPVCGMGVDMEKPPATSVYQGKTYYFCSPGCKKTLYQSGQVCAGFGCPHANAGWLKKTCAMAPTKENR